MLPQNCAILSDLFIFFRILYSYSEKPKDRSTFFDVSRCLISTGSISGVSKKYPLLNGNRNRRI